MKKVMIVRCQGHITKMAFMLKNAKKMKDLPLQNHRANCFLVM